MTFSGGGIADIRPTNSEGGALVRPGYSGVVSLRAHGTNRYALAVNAFTPAASGTSGLTQSQVDARIETWARAGSSGQLPTSKIPNLAASKITSGSFSTSRIPNLSASKITSGSFSTSRIPNLSASKITSGTIASARLPTNRVRVSNEAAWTNLGNRRVSSTLYWWPE